VDFGVIHPIPLTVADIDAARRDRARHLERGGRGEGTAVAAQRAYPAERDLDPPRNGRRCMSTAVVWPSRSGRRRKPPARRLSEEEQSEGVTTPQLEPV